MKSLFIAAIIFISSQAFATSPTATNYKNVIQGINAKFDRDWHSLNPQGRPDGGALMTLETLFGAFNTLGITGAMTLNAFIDQNVARCTGPATGTCNGLKVNITNSTHTNTLFGVTTNFTYDIVVWMDTGSGFTRFIEGSLTPPNGTSDSGKGNVFFTSCSGCTPVGHAQIEWDTTNPTYHLKTKMWETKMGGGGTAGGVVLDASYVKSTGDLKIATAATYACGTLSNDSTCAASPNSTAYTAMMHGNMTSGVSYVQGLNVVLTSTAVLDGATDALCVDASSTATPSACSSASLNNFTGMTPIPASTANALGAWSNSNWPFGDINDTPNF